MSSHNLHPFGSYRPKRDFRLVPPLCIGPWPALPFLDGPVPKPYVKPQNGFGMIDLQKHIWEGWTVGDFVERLIPELDHIMSGRSWRRPFTSKQELAMWCRENQPYYKKHIPGVVAYFARKYRLR